MSERDEFRQATAKVLDRQEVEAVLETGFYSRSALEQSSDARRPDKPLHYKVICISMYTEDLRRLDQMVDALKARGLTKANRSALIRYALGGIDLDAVPKGL